MWTAMRRFALPCPDPSPSLPNPPTCIGVPHQCHHWYWGVLAAAAVTSTVSPHSLQLPDNSQQQQHKCSTGISKS